MHIKIPAFDFARWQWEITRRVQQQPQPDSQNGITRPRYPLEEPGAREKIQHATQEYQQLVTRQDWVQAILQYRLNIHEVLFNELMDYREVIGLLQPFFDPDFTRLIHPLNESAQAFVCLTMARCLGALGYPHKAEGLILAHNRLRAKTGDAENHAWGLIELVRLRQFPGRQFSDASSNLRQVLKIARKQNFPSLLTAANDAQAQLHILNHDLSAAVEYLASAETISRNGNDFLCLVQIYCGWSQYELQRQHYFSALDATSRAIRLATRWENPRIILQAQIAHGKSCAATLMHSRQSPSEKEELRRETRHAIGAALKKADTQGLVFELLDSATQTLQLAWWEYKNAPQKNQHLKPEFVPFTRMLIQHAEQIDWQLKLPELHALLVQFE